MRKNFEDYETEYTLSKDWIFPYSEVRKGSDVVLYGAGDVGQAYYEQIRVTGYCRIVKWLDKIYEQCEGLGFRIESMEVLGNLNYDHIVVAVYSSKVAIEICNELISAGVSKDKIVWIGNERQTIRGTVVERRLLQPIENRINHAFTRRGYDINDEELIRYKEDLLRDVIDGKLILPRIVVALTPVCTLRCKKCNNLMPMYEHPIHIPVEEVIRDIDRLLENVERIITLELIGGEPFGYPGLAEVLKKITDSKKIIEIELTTNGTLIPDDEVMEILNSCKIIVKVSKYDTIKNNTDIRKAFVKNGVKYETFKEMRWIDSGETVARERDVYDNRQIYMKCDVSYYCKTLLKGKIYACARSASLYDLGICNDKNGYVDLREADDVKEKIKRFYLKDYDPACDYCDYADKWRLIPAGLQR